MTLISTLILVATVFLLGLFIGGILVFGVCLETMGPKASTDLKESCKRHIKENP